MAAILSERQLTRRLDGFRTPQLTGGEAGYTDLDHLLTSKKANILADMGFFRRNDVGFLTRRKYPETAERVDSWYTQAKTAFDSKPNPQNLDRLRQTIGIIGAFNYIRGMWPFKTDGAIDRKVASRIKLSPAASVQVLAAADIQKDDRVLALFSGVGYFSFFLAVTKPATLTCIDLYTPIAYDLEKTFRNTYDWIFKRVPEDKRPPITAPTFMRADCRDLPAFGDENPTEPVFTKIFLHPPYGRESNQPNKITEADGFVLWLQSLKSLRERNGEGFEAYSIVPSEWTKALKFAIRFRYEYSEQITISHLNRLLLDNFYYKRRSIRERTGKKVANWEELLDCAKNFSVAPQRETRRFGIDIVKHAF